jgi:ribosome maturation factor RimP
LRSGIAGISPVLDVEDPVEKAYHLEISSPGIDRPLVRRSDFERWQGHLARCDASVLINGRKRFRGFIRDVTETGFSVERDQPAYGEENIAVIPFSALAEAKLVLTDELIRESLRADKAAKAARAANENDDGDRHGRARLGRFGLNLNSILAHPVGGAR